MSIVKVDQEVELETVDEPTTALTESPKHLPPGEYQMSPGEDGFMIVTAKIQTHIADAMVPLAVTGRNGSYTTS